MQHPFSAKSLCSICIKVVWLCAAGASVWLQTISVVEPHQQSGDLTCTMSDSRHQLFSFIVDFKLWIQYLCSYRRVVEWYRLRSSWGAVWTVGKLQTVIMINRAHTPRGWGHTDCLNRVSLVGQSSHASCGRHQWRTDIISVWETSSSILRFLDFNLLFGFVVSLRTMLVLLQRWILHLQCHILVS